MTKKLFFLVLLLFMIPVSVNAFVIEYDGEAHEYTGLNCTLNVDGKTISTPDMPPIIMNDRTLVPLRELCESLGAVVSYDSKRITIDREGDVIKMTINKNETYFNDELVRIPDGVTPKLINFPGMNAKTMVPARFIAETLGKTVDFDEKTSTVLIYGNPYEKPNATINDTKYSLNSSKTKLTLKLYADDDFSENVSSFTLSNPSRVVFDIPKTKLDLDSNTINISGSDTIDSIRFGYNEGSTRVVVDVSGEISAYNATKSGKLITITVSTKEAVVPPDDDKDEDTYIPPQPPAPSEEPEEEPEEDSDDTKKITITDADYTISDNTKLTLKLKTDTDFDGDISSFKLSNPTRAVFDIKNTDLDIGSDSIDISGSKTISEIRFGYKNDCIRVVVDVNGEITSFKSSVSGKTITITVTTKETADSGNSDDDDKKPVTDNTITTVPTSGPIVVPDNPSDIKKKTIVLDAGHGGSDPGAVSSVLDGQTIQEKKLTLAIVLKVRDILVDKGYSVVLTRATDKYPSLDDRAELANRSGAALFVSIHMNSSPSESPKGTETYYSTINNGNDFNTTSKTLATNIQTRLQKALNSTNRGVKTANHAVTRKSLMPAALVEVGFISNAEEAALLTSSSYQNKAASAIAEGIIATWKNIEMPEDWEELVLDRVNALK